MRGLWTLARRSSAVAASALMAWVVGCDTGGDPGLSKLNAAETPSAVPPQGELSRLEDQVAFTRHEVEQRERVSWELPAHPKDEGCGPLTTGKPGADELIVLARDARVDTRQLLPLRLLQSMASNDLLQLEPHYAASSQAGAKRKLRSVRDGELALVKLRQLAQRRYAAVFHVTHYVEPKFFHDPKKRKPEWNAGWMLGWLAVHELGEPEATCQWRIEVRGDAGDASLARRLREATKRQLILELAVRFREAGKRAHSRLGTGLTWPNGTR